MPAFLRFFLIAALATSLPVLADGTVVINEVHFNPPDNTVRQEFIELHNPGDEDVDLTGWRMSGAVNYAFPDDTTVRAGGYLVIAEDPPTMRTLRSNGIGPWVGNLAAEGETIRLRNGADDIVDLVDYKVGFPWPVAADGSGSSIELIHPSLDNSLGSSWRSSENAKPTPNAPNSVLADNAAPNIRKVQHTPQQPKAAEETIITALVTDPDGVASVMLQYQKVLAGRYVPSHLPLTVSGGSISIRPRAKNRLYDQGWLSLEMLDDGNGRDEVAGDGIYTATIPQQPHRTLVRYRIIVEDEEGLSQQVPYPDDASLNFAYFVYNGVPEYNGQPVEVLETLPVYHLLTRGQDYSECFAYNGSSQISQGTDARFFYNWNGTLVYDGVVYDNIRYRLRGANGRYHRQGKRSMRFRLNDGYFFQGRDQYGKKYPRKWRTLTTGKGFDNRGTLTYAMNEAVSMYLFNKIGVPGPRTHWVHWRVIDGANETDRWRGDFHGLNFVIETYDVRFMEAHGLEKGNLYKLINQTQDWSRQQRYQAANGAKFGRDHNTIESSLDGGDSEAYIRAHVNVEKWNHWHALAEAIRHYDFWPSANKNMVYYFEPDYTRQNNFNGKLWILPWDTDASWGPTWNSGHDVVYNAYFSASGGGADGSSTPSLWPEYFNTVRELRNLLWQRDQIGPVINEFSNHIAQFERADALRWKGAPSDAGNYSGLGGAGASSLRNLVRDLNNFAFTGGSWPGGSVGSGGRAAHLDSLQGSRGEGSRIPRTPRIVYTGEDNFPTNGLSFQSSAYTDPQGAGSFGAIEWRIASITDPDAPAHDPDARFKLEWEADWESGELTDPERDLTVPTTAVRSGTTYRARVRHKDNTGRWSHWSAPVEFTTTLPDIEALRQNLVISEVHYHPIDPNVTEFEAGFDNDGFFEYIELINIGDMPLDLTDVRFTKGIDFDFLNADITSLAPRERVLVVANKAAFEMRYGPDHPVAGEWDPKDRLSNGGERIKLSFGAGDGIRDFEYGDSPPWPSDADGSGYSLNLIDPSSSPDPSMAHHWRSSYAKNGTPGTEESDLPFHLWMALRQQASNPDAPFGTSALSNLLAYALGADLAASPQQAWPRVIFHEEGATVYPALRFRLRKDPTLQCVVEVSSDLETWSPETSVEVGEPLDNGDGTVIRTIRTAQSTDALGGQYLRLNVSLQTD